MALGSRRRASLTHPAGRVYAPNTSKFWNTDKPHSGPVGRPGPRASSLPRPGGARHGLGVKAVSLTMFIHSFARVGIIGGRGSADAGSHDGLFQCHRPY